MPGVGVWSWSGLCDLTKEEMREQEVLPALPGQLHFLLLLQTGRAVHLLQHVDNRLEVTMSKTLFEQRRSQLVILMMPLMFSGKG